jgi:hypothetical protein
MALLEKKKRKKNPLGGRIDQPHAPAPRMHRARMQTAPPRLSVGVFLDFKNLTGFLPLWSSQASLSRFD